MSKGGQKLSLAEVGKLFSNDTVAELPTGPSGRPSTYVGRGGYGNNNYDRSNGGDRYGQSYDRSSSFRNNDARTDSASNNNQSWGNSRNERTDAPSNNQWGNNRTERTERPPREESRADGNNDWRSGPRAPAPVQQQSLWRTEPQAFNRPNMQQSAYQPAPRQENTVTAAPLGRFEALSETDANTGDAPKKTAYIPPSKRNLIAQQAATNPQPVVSQQPQVTAATNDVRSSNDARITTNTLEPVRLGGGGAWGRSNKVDEFPTLGANKPLPTGPAANTTAQKVVTEKLDAVFETKASKKSNKVEKKRDVTNTELYRSFASCNSISIEELNLGFNDLDLSEDKIKENAPIVFSKSVLEGKLKMTAVFSTLKATGDNNSELLLQILLEIKKNSSEDKLLSIVDSSVGISECFVALRVDTLTRAELTNYLEKNGLLCLLPSDISSLIDEAINQNKSESELSAIIKKHTKPILEDRKRVSTSVSSSVFNRILAASGDAQIQLVGIMTPHLKLVCTDVATQIPSLFAFQKVMASLKPLKAVVSAVLTQLYSSGVYSPLALMQWKDDKKDTTPNKPQMLLALPKLLNKAEEDAKLLEPKEEEEEEEDEDDDRKPLQSNLNYE